jgi:hypothetical protein
LLLAAIAVLSLALPSVVRSGESVAITDLSPDQAKILSTLEGAALHVLKSGDHIPVGNSGTQY